MSADTYLYEASIISQVFAVRGLATTIEEDAQGMPVWFSTPSSTVFKLNKAGVLRDGIAKVMQVREDLQSFINVFRFENALVPDLRFRTLVRIDGDDQTVEINRIHPDTLDYQPAALDARTAMLGTAYRYGQTYPITWDMHRPDQPHTLIAGTTGSGKTNALLVALLSLAQNNSPDRLQIDILNLKPTPELRLFERLPHVAGVADDLTGGRTIVSALRREMDGRYAGDRPSDAARILVIDEYATTEEIDSSDFFSNMNELARKGREAGIHLVICTQKPSATVLDTQIRSNLQLRLCGAVATVDDSRTALGIKGGDAHLLPGRGAFVYRLGQSMFRVQVPYVADIENEIEQVAALYGVRTPVPVHPPAPVARETPEPEPTALPAIEWSQVERDAYMIDHVRKLPTFSQADCIRIICNDQEPGQVNTGGGNRRRYLKAVELLESGQLLPAATEAMRAEREAATDAVVEHKRDGSALPAATTATTNEVAPSTSGKRPGATNHYRATRPGILPGMRAVKPV